MKILFLVTEDWYFWSHRLAVARKLRDVGVQVVVMTRINRLGKALNDEGFCVIPWSLRRGALNPIREFYTFLQVLWAYNRVKPDLVHHIALKPILYGGLAARLSGDLNSVNAIAGLGSIFNTQTRKMRLVRKVLLMAFRRSLTRKGAITIFQNKDNLDSLVKCGAVPRERAYLIRGTGVNLHKFTQQPEPEGLPVVILPARMLWDKGVGEFVTAATILRKRGVSARFVLVGDSDPDNPASIPDVQLRAWVNAGSVEWWGHSDNMQATFAQSNLVCLPSYAEGLPKVLIEACACGRAVVTTNVAGCREVVRDAENGLLVPARDARALASALEILLKDAHLRARMAARGREIAIREFSESLAVSKTLAVYRQLLGGDWQPEVTVDHL